MTVLQAMDAYLALPYPGTDGACEMGNKVKFWEGTSESKPCVQVSLDCFALSYSLKQCTCVHLHVRACV